MHNLGNIRVPCPPVFATGSGTLVGYRGGARKSATLLRKQDRRNRGYGSDLVRHHAGGLIIHNV